MLLPFSGGAGSTDFCREITGHIFLDLEKLVSNLHFLLAKTLFWSK
jgi:hypothetical protein